MESLSRPFHTRKLSNASNLSGKDAYDGVFSGHRRKYAGVPAANVHDYREIFGNSQPASSIPVLDLLTFEKPSDSSSLNLRSSKPDYSKIFGGFRDEDIAVSYEELFGRDEASVPLSTRSTSQDSDDLSHQSLDALKQFNMSYHKINQRGKDGLDGTTHVAQLYAVPGFTCFIDETAPAQKMKTEKPALRVGVDSSKEGFPEKQPSGSAVKDRSKHYKSESFPEDKLFKTFEINRKSDPTTVSSPSASSTIAEDHKNHPKRSTAKNSEPCKTYTSESAPEEFASTCFDEEFDVNSDAAASAAALKQAIEKAQESIRIARESVGRKKKGLRSFSNKSAQRGFKVEARTQDAFAYEEQKAKNDEVRGAFERGSASSQDFPDFIDGKKLFFAKKFIDEIHGRISESAIKCDIPIHSSDGFEEIVSDSTQVMSEIESQSFDSTGNHEYARQSFEAGDTEKSRTVTSASEQADRRNNTCVDDYDGEIKLTESITGVFGHQGVVNESEPVEKACELEEVGKRDVARIVKGWEGRVDMLKPACFLHECSENGTVGARQEDGTSSQRPKGFFVHESCDKKLGDVEETIEVDKSRESKEHKDELAKDLNESTMSQKVEGENKLFQGCNQNDIEDRLNVASGLSENEIQEEVLVEEYIEKLENAERLKKRSDDEESKNGVEEASQWLESEDESKDDQKEEVGETFYDVCESGKNETAQICDINVEESGKTSQEDCEMKQKDNGTWERKGESPDEACEQEFEENSSSDDNDIEEGDINDNMDKTQKVNGARGRSTGSSCEPQQEDTEAMKAVDSSEEEAFFDKHSIDQTASDYNDDGSEVNSDTDFEQNETEVNDSGTTHDVEIGADESNKEKNIIREEETAFRGEIPKFQSAEGIKASQEPRVSKDQVKRIDEEAREREKCRLAVDRAIREARERAFAEARERAERAAVEKATAEVRQRIMTEAREKIVKTSVEAKLSSERASAQSKLRAERAAVERATAEARQRALEKAMSQKSVNRESASSSDLHTSNRTNTESAQRSKAKLEKHNRIMERAAEALAETEKRDRLAQKEQAERNRLAENLDADIKRWSSGKERNLRALLSTLQYILGPDSGWQPVSMTDIITNSAVKKAYRKATLCVHPDKLQQRGASIQHKYICEKVFDLLKAAWNRFNSKER